MGKLTPKNDVMGLVHLPKCQVFKNLQFDSEKKKLCQVTSLCKRVKVHIIIQSDQFSGFLRTGGVLKISVSEYWFRAALRAGNRVHEELPSFDIIEK